jgi:hypothetical protein
MNWTDCSFRTRATSSSRGCGGCAGEVRNPQAPRQEEPWQRCVARTRWHWNGIPIPRNQGRIRSPFPSRVLHAGNTGAELEAQRQAVWGLLSAPVPVLAQESDGARLPQQDEIGFLCPTTQRKATERWNYVSYLISLIDCWLVVRTVFP